MKKTILLAAACIFLLAGCSSEQAKEQAATEATVQAAQKPNQVQPIQQQAQKLPQSEVAKLNTKKPVQSAPAAAKTAATSDFKWYSLDEAMAANETKPKKFMIDMYTSWCGWCKVMDAKTFSDPSVQTYLDEHFYSVKFNAETRDAVTFKGENFQFMNTGRRGINGLAYKLLNGRASYPTIVYLDENLNPIRNAPGFKQVAQIMPELQYAATDAYKSKSLSEFQASLQ